MISSVQHLKFLIKPLPLAQIPLACLNTCSSSLLSSDKKHQGIFPWLQLFLIVAYVNDFIVLAKEYDIDSHRDILHVFHVLQSLRIDINVKKSVLNSSTTTKFVGNIIGMHNTKGKVW